ncbi:MAG: hypothetical protein RL328_1819 [Acidobacteriota bacterium]|jgi:hypothetical protein
MAFTHPIPRPFNERGISFYAPSTSGVFGISNSQNWILVGETADIRATLFSYLRGNDPKLLGYGPTGFVFEQCPLEVRRQRQVQLRTEYRPAYFAS